MKQAAAMELVQRRDRWIVLGGVAGITALAWGYMVAEARAMTVTGVCECAGMAMSVPDQQAWAPLQLIPLFLMWSEMMVAMMLPSAAPMLLMFAYVNRQRREAARPHVSVGVFALGYLTAWTGFSALAATAQWVLHGRALLSATMASNSPLLGGLILVGAGVFQWTPLKNACLAECRTPLGLLMTEWREGLAGAFRMGFKQGLYCTGCCWLLMALLFVAGVMNLWWVAIISVFVLLEKAAPKGEWVGRTAGVALAVWGGWLIMRGNG